MSGEVSSSQKTFLELLLALIWHSLQNPWDLNLFWNNIIYTFEAGRACAANFNRVHTNAFSLAAAMKISS